MEVVSERRPSEEEWSELLFAWRVCKHVKSNAIVLARDGATIGLGAGQMSRVDSVRIALEKAQSTVQGFGAGLGRLLPVPRRAGDRARAGRDRDHPARRLDPRPAGGRGGRPRRCGDGLHRPPPLPPLVRPGPLGAGSQLSSEQPQVKRLGGDPPSPYEGMFGYNRMVGRRTMGADRRHDLGRPERLCRRTTPYEQTVEILRKLAARAVAGGLSAGDVVQTRMYVTDISRCDEVGRAHGEAFGDAGPVTSMVEVSGLIDPRMLVEIELVAYRA